MPVIDPKTLAEEAAKLARDVKAKKEEQRPALIEAEKIVLKGFSGRRSLTPKFVQEYSEKMVDARERGRLEAGRERSKEAAEKRMEAAKLPDLKARELVAETARNHRGVLEGLMGSNNYNERVEKNYNEARNRSKEAAEDKKTQGR